MIIYDRLWETMKRKGISQYRLIKYFRFSSGQLGRLRKNRCVSTHTIDILCAILDCKVEDIMEFRHDPAIELEIKNMIAQNNSETIASLYSDQNAENKADTG